MTGDLQIKKENNGFGERRVVYTYFVHVVRCKGGRAGAARQTAAEGVTASMRNVEKHVFFFVTHALVGPSRC